MRFFNLLAGFRECTSLSARYWAEGGAFRDANEQIEKMHVTDSQGMVSAADHFGTGL